MIESDYIKECALQEGFDLVGVTYPRNFDRNETLYNLWLLFGYAGSLDYMHRHLDLRFNPANLMEETRSVVVCALNYKNEMSLGQNHPLYPKIASYALAPDYHKVIRRSLRSLLRRLQLRHPQLNGRCCVDSAPLLEKQLAVEAGLGWIGRQTLLITPQFGSFVLLGVLLLDDTVDHYDTPYSADGCGHCNRCVDYCPNGAIRCDKMIDTRLCVSALTIECDTPGKKPLDGCIFGCDTCQSCCPHNQKTPLATNPAIQPIITPPSSKEWRSMTPEEFTTQFEKTPLKRSGLTRLLRNLG